MPVTSFRVRYGATTYWAKDGDCGPPRLKAAVARTDPFTGKGGKPCRPDVTDADSVFDVLLERLEGRWPDDIEEWTYDASQDTPGVVY